MNKTEKDILFKTKRAEGKDIDTCVEEIARDIEYEKTLKILNNKIEKYTKRTERLSRQIEEYKKKNNEIKNKKFVEKLKEIDTDYATTKDLNRILAYVQDNKRVFFTDLCKTTLIKPSKCKNGINFLAKLNLLQEGIYSNKPIVEIK